MVIIIFLKKLKFWSMEVATILNLVPKIRFPLLGLMGIFFQILVHTFLKLLTKYQLYIILFGVITHFDCTRESLFKITLRILVFYQFGIRIWDPIQVDWWWNSSGYILDNCLKQTWTITVQKYIWLQCSCQLLFLGI